jgi:hypothetical protein
MKPNKQKTEKDTPEAGSPSTGSPGIDFLVVLQAGAGLLCLLLVAWVVLRFVLHII